MQQTPVLLNAKQGFFYSLKGAGKPAPFNVTKKLRRIFCVSRKQS